MTTSSSNSAAPVLARWQPPPKHGVMVALLDLDQLGRANSELDSNAGDRILEIVGARLCEAVRSTDTVSHIDSDEFAVMIEGPKDGELICRRLLERIAEPMDVNGVSVWMTASIGAVVAVGGDLDEFLRRAAIALGQSKERGGDCCTVAGRS